MRWLLLIAPPLVVACGSDDCPSPITPLTRDTEAARQWYLPQIGATTLPADEGAPVVVAVLDNAIDAAHEDLVGRMWSDSEGNHGFNFLRDSSDVQLAKNETRAHGTACAGIVGAQSNNDVGVAGLCPPCRMMALVGRDFDQTISVMPYLSDAVDFARDNGARVLSISDGALPDTLSNDELTAIESAMANAEAAGIVVVASAGNDGREVVRFPAAIPTVLAVAASDCTGGPAVFTSYGAEVDVVAPGECVRTLAPDDDYTDFAGTSAAAPIVASLAALLLHAHPTWTPAEVRKRIIETSRPIDTASQPALEGLLGAGLIHFETAL